MTKDQFYIFISNKENLQDTIDMYFEERHGTELQVIGFCNYLEITFNQLKAFLREKESNKSNEKVVDIFLMALQRIEEHLIQQNLSDPKLTNLVNSLLKMYHDRSTEKSIQQQQVVPQITVNLNNLTTGNSDQSNSIEAEVNYNKLQDEVLKIKDADRQVLIEANN